MEPTWFLTAIKHSYLKLKHLNSFLLLLFSFGWTSVYVAERIKDWQTSSTLNKPGNTSSLFGAIINIGSINWGCKRGNCAFPVILYPLWEWFALSSAWCSWCRTWTRYLQRCLAFSPPPIASCGTIGKVLMGRSCRGWWGVNNAGGTFQ